MVVNGRYVFTFIQGPGYYQLADRLIKDERRRLAELATPAQGAQEEQAEAPAASD
jgi:hypothetical protein